MFIPKENWHFLLISIETTDISIGIFRWGFLGLSPTNLRTSRIYLLRKFGLIFSNVPVWQVKSGLETPKPVQTAVMRLPAGVLSVLGARSAPGFTAEHHWSMSSAAHPGRWMPSPCCGCVLHWQIAAVLVCVKCTGICTQPSMPWRA